MKKLIYLLLLLPFLSFGQSSPIDPEAVYTDLIESLTTNGDLPISGNGTGVVSITDGLKLNYATASTLAYLNSSKVFTSLANGAALQVLRMNSGATGYEWATPTSVTFGTAFQMPFINSGATDFTYSSNLVWNNSGSYPTFNSVAPVSSSSGFAIKNNAGTSIAVFGVGSSSSTNNTITGNTTVTGDWDVSGYVEGGNLRMTVNTLQSNSGALNLSSASGQDINLSSSDDIVSTSTGTTSINGANVTSTATSIASMIGGGGNDIQVNSSGIELNADQTGDDITLNANGDILIPKASNQFITGVSTNLTTVNFPASSGSVTVTMPNVTSTVYSTASGSITSSQLATSVTDETGSGALVFGTSPTFTTGITTANLTATGTRTFGANGRTIILDKTVSLTDATATTVATITLPTGSNLGGLYTVKIEGMIVNPGNSPSTAGNVGGKRLEASLSFGQDSAGNSSELAITTSSAGTSFGDGLATRDVTFTAITLARSGTDNSVNSIQLNVDGIGSGGATGLSFIGTITVTWFGFTSFTAQ